ncbi:hypothetical protein TNCV_3904911 [Trichonephila clavipes]|nr:hypothetical protein TNCV_3904911 [Trichonephila clavipes]
MEGKTICCVLVAHWTSDPEVVGPLQHGGALNCLQATTPLLRLVGGEERYHSQGVPPPNWDGIEQNRTVICMVL